MLCERPLRPGIRLVAAWAQAHLLVKDFGLRLPALLDRKDAVEKLVKKKVYSIGPKRAAHIKAGWDANPRACAHP